MSSMSFFEQSARNSAAMSILNKKRHFLQGRPGSSMTSEELDVLKEAITSIEKPNFEYMVVNNFQGVNIGLHSAITSVSVALRTAAEQSGIQVKELSKLLLDDEYLAQQPDKKSLAEKILSDAIQASSSFETSIENFENLDSYSKGL